MTTGVAAIAGVAGKVAASSLDQIVQVGNNRNPLDSAANSLSKIHPTRSLE